MTKREFFLEVEKLLNISFEKFEELDNSDYTEEAAYQKGRFHAFNTVLLMMGELE